MELMDFSIKLNKEVIFMKKSFKSLVLKILFLLILVFIFVLKTEADDKLNVVTTYPYIASIVKEIVKDKANVDYLADSKLDPHHVVPKPSLAVKLRKADLLIINGASLEIGWLPPLIDLSNNNKINFGTNGFLDLSQYFDLIDKVDNVSRAKGDVHPDGNPHFSLDPYNIPKIADVITERLCILDNKNCNFYKDNLGKFKNKWEQKVKDWNKKMENIKGLRVFEYHKSFDYFFKRYNIVLIDTLEPLPGIPPTSKHIEDLVKKAKDEKIEVIITDVYHPIQPVSYISEKTGIKFIILPHDVYSIKEVNDIFELFDYIVNNLSSF
jgi:zinc/manganese transport system substrate-binding protein